MNKAVQPPPYFVALSSGLLGYRRGPPTFINGVKQPGRRISQAHPDGRFAVPFRRLNDAHGGAYDAIGQVKNAAEYYAILVKPQLDDIGPFYVNLPNGFLIYDIYQESHDPRSRVRFDVKHTSDLRSATPFDSFETADEVAKLALNMLDYSPSRRWFGIYVTPRYAEE